MIYTFIIALFLVFSLLMNAMETATEEKSKEDIYKEELYKKRVDLLGTFAGLPDEKIMYIIDKVAEDSMPWKEACLVLVPIKKTCKALNGLAKTVMKVRLTKVLQERIPLGERINWDEVIKLTEYGADVNVKNGSGDFILLCAISAHRNDVIKKLFDYGADVNAKDDKGITPLMAAVYYNHPDTIRLLLNQEAIVDRQDETGITALIYAASTGRADCVKEILQKNPNTSLVTKNNETAMDCAERNNHKNIVGILQKHATP